MAYGTHHTQNPENLMNDMLARRLTGGAGIAAAVALLVEVPLYFIYSGPPPDGAVGRCDLARAGHRTERRVQGISAEGLRG
ncbi:hypothetical protein [Streptomyces sp. NPDC001743]|uniref:hypothetical protein n=1 Tax=Streptomyces sp. NPDC001743 TaxID=3154397 RepID=UPI003329E799